MKSIKFFVKLITLFFFIISCSEGEDDQIFLKKEVSSSKAVYAKGKSIKYPEKLDNELIIAYKKDIAEAYKKSLRVKYEITSYKTCNCNNTRIEKWVFPSGIDVEGRKDDIVQEGGVEGVDYQFIYPNQNTTPSNTIINQSNRFIASFIKPIGERLVTVAIIDTGINLTSLGQIQPFLYNNTPNMSSCIKEVSGWDFVNHDNNIFDDNGHGTIVTNIIMNKLKNEGIDNYQILPVKAFNKFGVGTTFDILCSYLYVISKPEVSIINMSFGWYKHPSDLLSIFILENSQILHLTSAGNDDNNNDDLEHFPSSIIHENILSIGSYYKSNNDIVKSKFSNYGKCSVDFLSNGDRIPFYNHATNTTYFVSGTSYATPYVTAYAMKYFLKGHKTPSQILNQLAINTRVFNSTNLFPVVYKNRIIK
ncbi:hypothetical protein A8C32_15020 [Flavivirga aquatica]|uniref:Peptidase S8/S53 domain-containing protein n=1 Tax=Flavivirga aquatica TaxID=1849968 RepID=A0A1E5T8X1_9FLAO|nr:S8 family serine peptidase [Flavivirga aquatica]OEK07796.1 hypothetical protein A8C32_15020 [Flavivirga aquatica]